jgi:hypothetical protein
MMCWAYVARYVVKKIKFQLNPAKIASAPFIPPAHHNLNNQQLKHAPKRINE